MELRGLEPLTFALPARRSSQLSYSPGESEVVRKVNACPLSVARGSQPQVDLRFSRKAHGRQQKAAVQFAAVDREQIDFIRGVRTVEVASGRKPG